MRLEKSSPVENPMATPARGRVRLGSTTVVFGDGDNQTVALAPTDLVLQPGTFTASLAEY